jgi:hypothetical protein
MRAPRTYRRVRRAAGRNSATWRTKKILASLIVVGALGSITAAGTYAQMNSETGNPLSTASTGTLTLSNTVNAGTACFSYGAGSTGNSNPGCTALFTSATLNYPGTPVTSKVQITDNGSIDASNLSVWMTGCSTIATPGAPTPGGGNPCDATIGDNFALQETDSSGTATFCWYPDFAAGACTLSAGTLGDFFTYVNSSSPYDLALTTPSGPAAGQSRYFSITVQVPTGASNTLQGEAAVFGLTWHVDQ